KGPAPVTENLTFTNVPNGFTLLASGTSVTIPAGQTGIVGLYLVPMAGGQLPAPESTVSFTVTATNAANPADVLHDTDHFTMPAIYAVSVAGNPAALSTPPGTAATDTLTLTNDGNVVASAAVSVATGRGVTAAT